MLTITKENRPILIIALLAGITIFSLYKYILALREKQGLLTALEQIKIQASSLEIQKQNLLQALDKEKSNLEELARKNMLFKENLAASQMRMNRLFVQLKEIDKLNAEALLLREQNAEIWGKLEQLNKEKEGLQARLSSLSELKRAMQELRNKQRQAGARIKEGISPKPQEEVSGNLGFIIKDGKPTLQKKIKIEVAPALKN